MSPRGGTALLGLALAGGACMPSRPPVLPPTDSGSGDDSGHEVVPGDTAPEDTGTGPDDVPEADDPTIAMFDGSEIPAFYLTIPKRSMDALEADPYTYVTATIQYGDTVVEDVGVRLKGQNSYQPISGKAGFRIKMDEFAEGRTLLGLKDLTLNNMISDPSMMHERIAYALYREVGVPAPRSTEAAVYLNGEYYGLLENTETPNKQLQERWYENPDGSLWEGWDVDFYDQYVAAFSLEYGIDDRTRIQGTADAMELGGREAIEAVEAYLNFARFLDYWAVGAVVGQFDAYPYGSPGDDFHVYDDPDTGQLWFQPWGMDECLGSPTYDVTAVYGVLAATCLRSAACRNDWIDRIWHVVGVMEQMDLAGQVGDVAAQIQEYAEMDARKPYSMSDVAYYQGIVLDMIRNRQGYLEPYIGRRPE